MASTPLLRLIPPPEADSRDPALWRACWVRDGEMPRHLHCGSLAEAGRSLQGVPPVVYVPGETVLLTTVPLPRGRRAQLLAALPYALEEQLIDDVERLHCALGAPEGDGRWQAAVVDRACMETWLAVLGAAGITPAALLPDSLLPPPVAEGWRLVCDSERIVIRQGANRGFVCQAPLLPALLKRAVADDGCPERFVLHGCETPFDLEAHCPDSRIETVAPPGGEAGALDPLLLEARPTDLNLLQGDYSPRSQLAALLRPWAPAAALLGLLLILGLTSLITEYRELRDYSQRLEARMQQVFRETFPEVKRIVNPRTQMRHRLAALRGGDQGGPGFTAMLARLAPLVRRHEKVEVTHLRYANGRLEMRLVTPDLKTLDALRETLAQNTPWTIELKSANASGEQVDGRIVITP